ncbi:MAG: DMT family transporter [Chloroflexota bacterium]
MSVQALPFILLQGLLFGSNLIAMRFSLGQFQPITFNALRLILASLLHASFYLLNGRRYKWPTDPHLWRHAALLGVFGAAIPTVAIVGALQYQSAGVTSALLTTGPAVTVLLAHFFLADERLTAPKGIGVALALGGALLLTLRGEVGLSDGSPANPIGYGLVFLAMLSGSSMTIYIRRFLLDLDYLGLASARIFVATAFVMPFSALLEGLHLQDATASGYLVLGYSAIVIVAGLLLDFYNVRRFGATAAAMPMYVIPAVASLGGAVFLDEQITSGMMFGMALILIGIMLVNRRQGHKL